VEKRKGTIQYSEAFKRKVVQEYENGASMHSLQRKYGIGGNTTIQKWVRKYGTRPQPGKTESPEEEIRRLKARIAQLEKAVSNLTVEKLVLESTLEVYQEEYGVVYAKKNGRRSSRGRGRKGKGR